MWKGTPKRLPEELRIALSQILQFLEDTLRAVPDPADSLVRRLATPVRPITPYGMQVSEGRDVTVFRDTDEIDAVRATEWIKSLAVGIAFALWITQP